MNVQDVKAAEAIAVTYLRDLYSDERLTHICLDDVWLSDDEKYWYDTIGDDAPTSAQALLAALRQPEREYTLFKVCAEDGRVPEGAVGTIFSGTDMVPDDTQKPKAD
jgi:hypothetical protein